MQEVLRGVIEAYRNVENMSPGWGMCADFYRDRAAIMAHINCSLHMGDIVEIGAFEGDLSVKLAAVAEQFGRTLIVIDPWETGTQNCSGVEFDRFIDKTDRYRDSIDVVRASSQSKQANDACRGDLAFAVVDGLHEFDPCLADIVMVKHAKMICVDDTLTIKGCSDATRSAQKMLGKRLAMSQYSRESYLW